MTILTHPHVLILGAGPAGLGAAYQLTRRGLARVTVLERQTRVGGAAGSFEVAGQRVDYGSHRLHPASDPEVLGDIRKLLGDDLLDRPRHGRIHLQGRWIHFPLKPADLALRLPPAFMVGVLGDGLRKAIPHRNGAGGPASFASVLEAGLGQTICRDFYFPYARKVWGLPPEELAATQARRRVAANSLPKMVGKALAAVPGLKPKGKGRFFYPRRGFGQICEAYAAAAQAAGAEICLGAAVEAVEIGSPGGHVVHYRQGETTQQLAADYVWSTIPITALARCLTPAPPPATLQAAQAIDYRAMLLVYLVVEQDRFTEYDAHYFPGADIPITRLSEPKNYAAGEGPTGQTVLCAEMPCSPDGSEWGMTDEALGGLVRQALEQAGLPLRAPVRQVVTRRLRQAYPIYRQGYAAAFDRLDDWLSGLDGLLTFGRQGLFAHDNTHHALYMAYCAADCLGSDGQFDRAQWRAYRQVFETHVVED